MVLDAICVAAVGWDRYVVLLAVGLERFGRFWMVLDAICVAAVCWDRYVVLLAVGLERSERFWRVLDCILGRGGRLGSLRSLASSRSGAFRTVLEGFGRYHQPCQQCPLPSLASLPAPAFLLFLPLFFFPLSFHPPLFPFPPVFFHRDKFKAR